MEIVFNSRKIEKLCNSSKEMRAKLGDRTASLLQLRLTQMRAAHTLEELLKLPGVRCHELSHNRKGQLVVDLVHPNRLIFRPDDDPVPRKADGGLDWQQVRRVLIIEITDYH